MIEKLAPDDVRQASQKAVSDLRARRFESVEKNLAGGLQGQDHSAVFVKMADFFPDEEPTVVSAVEYYFNTGTSGTRYDIAYEYKFSHGWVLAEFEWVRANGQLRIATFNVYPMKQSLEEQNAFTLRGKGLSQFLALIMGALALSISVTALVKCIRVRGLRRKWLWIIFILIGFGTYSVNWNTGAWHIFFLRFQLMSFSAFALAGSPWTVSVSVPVGAVIFLEKLRRRRSGQELGAVGENLPLI
jgi:hypothetical protein